MAETFDGETPYGEARGILVPRVSLCDGVDERWVREVASPLHEVVRLEFEVEDVQRRFLAHNGCDNHIELKRQLTEVFE